MHYGLRVLILEQQQKEDTPRIHSPRHYNRGWAYGTFRADCLGFRLMSMLMLASQRERSHSAS